MASLNGTCPNTIILESRTQYTNDRTWCFWHDLSLAPLPWITHSWTRFSIKTTNDIVIVECPTTPYQMIPADRFYNHALEIIDNAPLLTLQKGVTLREEPYQKSGLWHVTTPTGIVTAPKIIDTRPISKPHQGDAVLWQSFLGVEINVINERFDPTLVDLMDFSLKSAYPILFTYMLPLTKNCALIEVTVFGPDPLYPVDLNDFLNQAIRSHIYGQDFTILRREHGILPMGQKHKKLNLEPTYIKAGLTAGGARPSSGFTFQRIQRWADCCARAISEGNPLIGHRPDPLMLQAMDKLFLQVLTKCPEIAPQLFLSLFMKVPSQRLIRFLSDHATPLDCLAIMKALPAKPFLKELREILMTKSH